jgi:hypothetical protein
MTSAFQICKTFRENRVLGRILDLRGMKRQGVEKTA